MSSSTEHFHEWIFDDTYLVSNSLARDSPIESKTPEKIADESTQLKHKQFKERTGITFERFLELEAIADEIYGH